MNWKCAPGLVNHGKYNPTAAIAPAIAPATTPAAEAPTEADEEVETEML